MPFSLLLVALFLAQQPDASRPEQPRKPVLEGVVLQEGSGQPVAKAAVTLMRTGSAEMNPPKVEASADGTFKFEELTPGTYTVIAERNGYSRRAYGAKNDGALRGLPVRLSMNETRKIEIKLFKQGVIAGKVADADGEAVQGVIVVALRQTYQRGRKLWMPVGQVPVQTNDVGEFRLSSLPSGKFIVCGMPMSLISGAGMGGAPPKPGPSGKPESSIFTCYPNVTDRATAPVVEVGDGAEVPGINIQLARRVVSRVRGQVTGLPANLPQIFPLSLAPKGSGVSGMMFSNRALASGSDGKFDFLNVTPGSYVLHTLPTGLSAATFTVKMPLEVGEEAIDQLSVPALVPMEVQGQVTVEGKQETTGLENARLVLSADDDVYAAVPIAPVKQGGGFTLGGVAPDRYVIALAGMPENFYIKSARYGDRSWTDHTVEISAPLAPFAIIVADDAATITGSVRDEKGEPVQGAYVVLVDKAQRRGRNRSVRSDEKGAFRITGVEPGEYSAFAASDVDPGAIDDADYLKPWMSSATSTKADSRGQSALSLTLKP